MTENWIPMGGEIVHVEHTNGRYFIEARDDQEPDTKIWSIPQDGVKQENGRIWLREGTQVEFVKKNAPPLTAKPDPAPQP